MSKAWVVHLPIAAPNVSTTNRPASEEVRAIITRALAASLRKPAGSGGR